MTCPESGDKKRRKHDDKKIRRQLTKFEREGTHKYLFMKRCEEEKDAMSKLADSMLHNKIEETETKAERTINTSVFVFHIGHVLVENKVCTLFTRYRGGSCGSRGCSLGSDEPPSDTRKLFEAIVVGSGLNLGR